MSSPRPSGPVFNIGVTVLDVVLALVVFDLARGAGASEASAYLLSCIGPLLGGLAVWLRARQFSGASLAVLAFTVLSAVVALLGRQQSDFLRYKDAVTNGIVGVVFLGSLAFRRPLAFYFGQRFTTDGTHAGMAAFAQLWQHREFRLANRWITVVWGVAYVSAALGQVWLIDSTGSGPAGTWNQLLPFAAAAVAIVLTVVLTRYYRARGQAAELLGQRA